jgi:hypothetical protein
VKRRKKSARLSSGIDLKPQERMLDTQKAVGATDRQRLKWLINFANTDIQSPRRSPEELEDLDWQVFHFVNGSATHGVSSIEHKPQSEFDLVQLRNHALRGLHESADADHIAGFYGWNPNAIDIGATRPLDGLVRYVRRGFSAYSGPRLAVFLTSVADLIASEEGKRIRECGAKDCTAIFYKWKRGMYCSRQCSQRARVQRHRTKAIERE